MKTLISLLLLTACTHSYANSIPIQTGVVENASCRTTTSESVVGAITGESVGRQLGESLFGRFGGLAGGVAGSLGGSKVLASSETHCTLLVKATLDEEDKYVLVNTTDREYTKGEVLKLHIVGDMAVLVN